MVYNTRIPASLKTPVVGKFAVYTLSILSEPWPFSAEELNDQTFKQNVHMINSIEIGQSKAKSKIDSVKSITVVWNDSIHKIEKEEIHDWFYCVASERLKGYYISVTGTASYYAKNIFRNLIILCGGEYNPKPNERTNLIINCSGWPTKSLAYAKKHNIKKITETEFFQLFK